MDIIRMIERLPNGYWRFDMLSGLVKVARTDAEADAIRAAYPYRTHR